MAMYVSVTEFHLFMLYSVAILFCYFIFNVLWVFVAINYASILSFFLGHFFMDKNISSYDKSEAIREKIEESVCSVICIKEF